MELGYLGRGLAFCRVAVGINLFQDLLVRISMVRDHLFQTAPAFIFVAYLGIILPVSCHPVVVIISGRDGAGMVSNGFRDLLHLTVLVVVVGQRYVPFAAGLPVLAGPADLVVDILLGDPAGRIRYRCQFAVIVIAVGDGIAVLVGLAGYLTLLVVSIVYTITVAIRKSF